MARTQVNYSPTPEGVQRTAQVGVQAEQAGFDPRRSSAFQLAEALGVAGPEIDKVKQLADENDRKGAKAFANSMTVAELGKQIKDGKMLASKSPVFAATVNHIYGENTLAQVKRDLNTKMTNGEVSFETDAEMDQFLQNTRNEVLSGADRYAVAGFDKKWNELRGAAIDANAKIVNDRKMERATQEAADIFTTDIDNAVRENKTPEEIVGMLTKRHELLSQSKVLVNPAAQKQAWADVAQRLVDLDDPRAMEAVNRLLATKTPNNGPTVRAILGEKAALALQNGVEAADNKRNLEGFKADLLPDFDKAQNGDLSDQDVKRLLAWGTMKSEMGGDMIVRQIIASDQQAKAQFAREMGAHQGRMIKEQDAAMAAMYARDAINNKRPVQDYTGRDGTVYKAEEMGRAALGTMISEAEAAGQPMTQQDILDRQVNSNIPNPEMKRRFATLAMNLNQVNMENVGKDIGKLNEQSLAALDEFALVRQQSDVYAREMAGGEQNYKSLMRINALREDGVSPEMATALINAGNRNEIPASLMGKHLNELNSAMEELSNPSFFSGRWFSEAFRGEWGEAENNLLGIKEDIHSMAMAYVQAGVVNSAAEGVEKAVTYFKDQRVTVQIGNTLYLRKDLPQVNEGEDQAALFNEFVQDFVSTDLTARDIPHEKDELHLIPVDGGERPFRLHLGKQPMELNYTRGDFQSWLEKRRANLVDGYIADRNKPKTEEKKWYQFGPKNTFLTEDRLKQSREAMANARK